MYVRRLGFFCVLFLLGIGCLTATSICSGGEGSISQRASVPALRQIPIFQRLDEEQLRKVADVAEMAEHEGGYRIIEQGKRVGKMAVALDSEVHIRIDGKTIRVLPPNSMVGEIEFLENIPATADVVLVGKSRILFLEHRAFQRVMDADPSLGYRVMFEMARMEANRLRLNNQREPK